MMKYETGPFKKPAGMLLAVPAKRVTRKSAFLRKIERAVRANAAFEQAVAAANSEHAAESDYNSAPLSPTLPAELDYPSWRRACMSQIGSALSAKGS